MSMNSIYFDNSATTIKKPDSVAQAVYDAIASAEFANPSRGFYPYSLNSLNLLLDARMEVARLFGVDDLMKIVFTENITASLNIAINAYINATDHVITTVNEHNSVLRPLYNYVKDISYVDMNDDGTLKYEEFKKYLNSNTTAVVVSHCSNVSGILTDMDFIYKFCKENDLLLIVDGAQSAGCVKVDLSGELPEMIYCFTGHKSLYGPQGTGGMVILTNKKPKQVFSGGSGFDSFNKYQPEVIPDIFETGTRNIHSIAGLKAGVEYINSKGILSVERELEEKIAYLINGLGSFKNIEFYHNFDVKRAPIISFNIKNHSSEEISEFLAEKFVYTRAGIHCAPLHHERMGTKSRGMVRMSLSTFNTFEEIDNVLKIIEEKCIK